MREISESIGLIDILSAGFNGCNIYFLGGNAYALVKSIAYFLIFWYSLLNKTSKTSNVSTN
jgi:hypothetical protein